ncbi:5-formyltetrahydrofolate cyclo-ligase [Deferribacter desulfuricans SSM1]|uniref:5-formyltetrahydrofolate cyclo-ligase n=1 Tax=Deferribacter desulfuricans (strain DSM 14783 / JCM 11476 / NBRC 101012 / SSM1) TaxID=639282 RepID=D3PBK1_DEFDS|nr:5-formyltetrahydrofolate cyclo-ligase [Deferribacter desulfuricans]BAI79974.1 5-formyltetrahydrofolate cyclo-ligase [Deferribacter desulfuricans SSM1]
MNKNMLRQQFKEKRKNLDRNFVEKTSKVITDNFLSRYGGFDRYFLYVSFDNEVRTIELITHLKNMGKEVFLPILVNDEILAGYFEDFESMKKNRFGVLEPIKVTSEDYFDVVVAPGVVFDIECYRLGFGKGYYDRFLKKIQKKVCVGFAYDFQVIEKLPVEKHDVKLDAVLTEKREIGGY